MDLNSNSNSNTKILPFENMFIFRRYVGTLKEYAFGTIKHNIWKDNIFSGQ